MAKNMISWSEKNGFFEDNIKFEYNEAFRISFSHSWKNLKPYYGCPHSCWYCYVKANDRRRFIYLKEEVASKIPKFGRDMYVVKGHYNTIEKWINNDIKKGSPNKENYLHMAFCSDPFPYSKGNEEQYQEIIENTLKIMKMVNGYGYRMEFISKGVYPWKEIIKIDKDKVNSYGFSLPTLDKEYCDKYEPLASPLDDRINAIRELDKNGNKIWINIAPFFLGDLTDKNGNIVYSFKTGIKELGEFFDSITNIHHLRMEVLRGKLNPFKNEFTQQMKEDSKKFFNEVVKDRGIKRFFIDLGDNILDEEMDVNKKAGLYKDESRLKKQKMCK